MFPPIPFTGEDVREAFPNLTVDLPQLGQGSFKVAYLSHDQGQSRVLKVIFSSPMASDPDEYDMEQLPERIARELAGMRQVESEHLVSLLSDPVIQKIGERSYLCYEEPFYCGGTLEDVLVERPLSPEQTRELTVALLKASKALWDNARIVHRDIKPGNIVYGPAKEPVLIDLGLALFTEMSAITESALESPKTPRYAAPEQFEMRRNSQIDFRTDQYLIGLTVFEAATGNHPFWKPGIRTDEYFDLVDGFRPDSLKPLQIDDSLRLVLGRLLSPQMHGRFRTPDMPLQRLDAI